MEQRPLRLGDIVDDYCTRERRVTNHVIVALTEDVIRQTRCTTCDNEHPYKAAKEPRLRKKPGAETLYDQVLSNVAGASNNDPRSVTPEPMAASAAASDAASESDSREDGAGESRGQDGWVSHRTLIRASLPKTDAPPEPRPIPEFTMYQRPQPRGRNFRFGGHPRPFGGHQHGNGHGNGNGEANGNVNGNANGNRAGRGGFDGPPGQPSGRPGRRRRRRR